MLTPANRPHLTTHEDDSALQSKEFPNQTTKFKTPYFNVDIRSKILERAKKENLISEPQIQDPSEKASKVDHLGKASKIVEDLIKKHGIAK
jgi:hypothetical protein